MGSLVFIAAIGISLVFILLGHETRNLTLQESGFQINSGGFWKRLEMVSRFYTFEFTFLVALGGLIVPVFGYIGVYRPDLKYLTLSGHLILFIILVLTLLLTSRGLWLNWKQFGIRLSLIGFFSALGIMFWVLVIIFWTMMCIWDIESILESGRILCPTCP